MIDVETKKSKNPSTKFDAIITRKEGQKKTVSFGQAGYSEFTKHKDEDRKENYIARHKFNQDWKGYETAGMWAKNISWNKPTIEASIKDTKKRFQNLNIKNIF